MPNDREPTKRGSAKDEDHELDAEEQDDEAQDSEPAPERASRRPRRSARAREARPVRRNFDEKQIDSPSVLTLGMLGSVAFATVAMWGAAKFACNAHPPENRKPRDVTTAELARDPKSAAFELQQRWSAYDFAGALQLAQGSVADEIKRDQANCGKSTDCAKKARELGKSPLTMAALLEKDKEAAKVRVTSLGGLSGKNQYLMELKSDNGQWKVVSRAPYVAPPTPVQHPPMMPTPASSAAAPGADAGAPKQPAP